MDASRGFEPLHLNHPLAGPALAETLDGGQCFRWQRDPAGSWVGVSGAVAAELAAGPNGVLQVHIHSGTAAGLKQHLADERDWTALADSLPWRSDAHLAACIDAFPGLRILRQPIGETLLCFLCSATKQIVQIKQMVALLARRHGRALPVFSGAAAVHALPSWDELVGVDESALRQCLLGFRARHVAAVARFLADRPGWLEETAALPYEQARSRLVDLPGVGEKIADCVLLFGAGRLEAFPVDVWILRVMERRYGLTGWSPGQVAHFGRVHFGPLAGLAQQYLFAWERSQRGLAQK